MQCHLTAKDTFYLRSLLDNAQHDAAYAALLRQKLATTALFLDHTIDPRIATLNSRVIFSVGDRASDERILTRHDASSTPGLDLPVTSLTGLALLGLKEGQSFPLAMRDGELTPVRLLQVVYQPQNDNRTDMTPTVIQLDLLRRNLRSALAPEETGPGAA